ncbi:MAG: hypothetical protein ACE5DO_15330 [Desulfobacterales bacterium]
MSDSQTDPPESKLKTTLHGANKESKRIGHFSDWLHDSAEIHAKRRGSDEISDSDFENAFRSLVKPPESPFKISIIEGIGILLVAFGGAAIGAHITMGISESAKDVHGSFLILSGLLSCVGGVILQRLGK